jgi:hypothetical protein
MKKEERDILRIHQVSFAPTISLFTKFSKSGFNHPSDCICFFEKSRVKTIVPTIPIVCAILSMSENPITIPSTIKQNRKNVNNNKH